MEEQIEDLELDTEDLEQDTQHDSQDEVPEVVETIRQVPLEALEAERRKRQELEYQLRSMQQQKTEPDEDDDEFITKAQLKSRIKEATSAAKRDILEEAYCEANPEAITAINQHLENIIKRKPWLAQALDNAPNRFARAYEIVQDYMPKETAPAQKFSTPRADARRIVENSQKPGNPSTIAKTSNMNNADYLKSIAGKPEFREYRKKVMTGG